MLGEAQAAVDRYQRVRSLEHRRDVEAALGEVAPLLSYFRQFVPVWHHGHFVALATAELRLPERLLALTAAVEALRTEFTVKRAYLHPASAELRRVLEARPGNRQGPDFERAPDQIRARVLEQRVSARRHLAGRPG